MGSSGYGGRDGGSVGTETRPTNIVPAPTSRDAFSRMRTSTPVLELSLVSDYARGGCVPLANLRWAEKVTAGGTSDQIVLAARAIASTPAVRGILRFREFV